MHRPRILTTLIALSACAAAIGACSAGGGSDGDFTPGSGGQGGAAGAAGEAGNPSTGGSAVPDGGMILEGGPNTDAAPNFESEVFGHSRDTLYKLDPKTKKVTVVGQFSGCDSITDTDLVIDIALDQDSNLFGTTFEGLWKINKKTAVCTLIKPGSYPNSLSFVPQGTVDANEEALVGYLDDKYVRIDKITGKVSTIGGLTGGYISSGDIVSVKGGSTYLTVKGNECDDCLFEVNPKTGAMVKNWGKVGYSAVFGLAFWAGSVYGFSSGGDLFELTFTGGTLKTTAIPTGGASDLSFWGAGSTTAAPLTPIY